MASPPGIQISPEVADALEQGRGVVALESAFLTHGLPNPDGQKTMTAMHEIVSSEGAVPAAVAVVGRVARIGLAGEHIERLAAAGQGARKIGLRELGLNGPNGENGGTTVSATAYLASRVGIRLMCTGGIGGVHPGTSWDVSADLLVLSQYGIAVVCSGVKSILDVGATLEVLESLAIPVIGYQTTEIPGFVVRRSGFGTRLVVDGPGGAASALVARRRLGLDGGVLVCVPVPEEDAVPGDILEAALEDALAEAGDQRIRGQQLTPFLLRRLDELTDGATRRANVALLKNNARVAAQIAVALSFQEGRDL